MEYRLTFEDGSEVYLEHFGVKGMHWGVWNAETRQRRMGGSGRKANSSSSSGTVSSGGKKGMSDKTKRRLKTAAVVLGTAAVVGGGVYLARHKAVGKMIVEQRAKKEMLDKNWAKDQKRLRAGAKATRDAFRKTTWDKHPTWTKGYVNAELNSAMKDSKQSWNTYRAYKWQRAHAARAGLPYAPNGPEVRKQKNYLGYGRRMNQYVDVYGKKRDAYKKAKGALSKQTAKRYDRINTASKIGAVGAAAAGAGAGYAYNRKSRKSSKKNGSK